MSTYFFVPEFAFLILDKTETTTELQVKGNLKMPTIHHHSQQTPSCPSCLKSCPHLHTISRIDMRVVLQILQFFVLTYNFGILSLHSLEMKCRNKNVQAKRKEEKL